MDGEDKADAKRAYAFGYSRTLTLSPRRLRRDDAKSEVDCEESRPKIFGAADEPDERAPDETRQKPPRKWLHDDFERMKYCKSFNGVMHFRLSPAGNFALLIVLLDVFMVLECFVVPRLPILVQDILLAIGHMCTTIFMALCAATMVFNILQFFMNLVLRRESPPAWRPSFGPTIPMRQRFYSMSIEAQRALDRFNAASPSRNTI